MKNEKKELTPRQKNWLYTGIFLVIVAIFFIVNNSWNNDKNGPYPPGYLNSNVEVVKLSDFKGKVVLVDFWATWCPPCRAGIPDLVAIKNEFKNKEFEIIGISLDGMTRGGATKKDVIPFVKEFNINYPILDGNQMVIAAFGGINSIPTSFIIDKEGNIVAQHVGLVGKQTYVDEINSALQGKSKVISAANDFALQKF